MNLHTELRLFLSCSCDINMLSLSGTSGEGCVFSLAGFITGPVVLLVVEVVVEVADMEVSAFLVLFSPVDSDLFLSEAVLSPVDPAMDA